MQAAVLISLGVLLLLFLVGGVLLRRKGQARSDNATVSALAALLTYARDFRDAPPPRQRAMLEKILEAAGVLARPEPRPGAWVISVVYPANADPSAIVVDAISATLFALRPTPGGGGELFQIGPGNDLRAKVGSVGLARKVATLPARPDDPRARVDDLVGAMHAALPQLKLRVYCPYCVRPLDAAAVLARACPTCQATLGKDALLEMTDAAYAEAPTKRCATCEEPSHTLATRCGVCAASFV